MICIAVLLLIWIGIVWFQDKRSLAIIECQRADTEEKLGDLDMQDLSATGKDEEIVTSTYLGGPSVAR